MTFLATEPYNSLPHLPPLSDIETKQILKKCITARAAVAELKQAAAMLPNQSVLINTLPLLEAQASSEIENIVTTTDKLFQFAGTDENLADHATKEALRYRTALRKGYESIRRRPLCTSTAIEVCSIIKHVEMDVRAVPGTTLSSKQTGETIYTPPIGKALLQQKLTDWELFLHNNTDLDPLIKMAVGHYQFEAIHPFTDGNGRTGRVLNILYLIETGLLDIPVLYLSRYILTHRNEYYAGLRKVTEEQAWEEWILYMLSAVEETATWTCRKIKAILKLIDQTRAYVSAKDKQLYSRELIELLFVQPYCRIGNVVEADIAQRQTASGYLKKLADIDVLTEVKMGRDKVFINPRFMQLLLTDTLEPKPFPKV